MHWRLRYLFREALRNAFTTPRGRVVLIAGGILAVVGIALLRSDLSSFSVGQESRYLRGSQVFTIVAPRGDPSLLLRRSSCEEIAKDPRVARAGVLEDRGSEYIPQLGRRARIVDASAPLVPEAYRAGAAAIGEHISPGVETLHIRIGQRVLHATRLPPLPDGVNLNSAIVVPLPPEERWATTCLVSARSGADLTELAASAVAALQTRGRTAPAVVFAARDPDDRVGEFVNRATPAIIVLSGLLAGLAAAVLVRTRRAEFGVYRLAGTSSRELAVIITTEFALAAGVDLLLGMLGAVATGGWSEDAGAAALVLTSAALVMFGTGSALGSLQILGDPTRMVADR
jgi:hypothetical protein